MKSKAQHEYIRVIVLVLTLFGAAAAAQTTGSITGLVKDQSNASVPGAEIEAVNEATGAARSTISGEDGFYRLPLLTPGRYRLTASSTGFQTLVREGIRVSVNQTARVDLQLEVGDLSQSVTVTGDAPLIEASHATLGIVIDEKKIVDLPLNGRNFTQLGTLLPGVTAPPASLGGASGEATPGGFGGATTGFSVNGQRNQSNNFLLDGASNNDTFNSGFVLRPPPDAIKEFKILTHNYAAEYGRNSGSVVNVITKSGGNSWHGSAWEFYRNDALEARNFFALEKPSLDQHQFGGSIGGPIAEDRLFAFGFYEGFRNTEGITDQRVVLTEAERRGDFSQSGVTITDPLTGQPFDGNVIPQDRLDPVAQRLLAAFVPLPNTGNNLVARSPDLEDNRDQVGIRLDFAATEESTFFGRYLFSDQRISNPLGGSNFSPDGQNFASSLHDFTVGNTHVFGPQAINQIRFSFNRIFARPQTTSGIPSSEFGFETINSQPTAVGVPFVSLSGFFSLGDGQQIFSRRINNVFNFSNDFSYNTGRHFIKFGVDIQRQNVEVAFLNRPNGDHTFNGAFTGSAPSDFLLGLSRRYRQGGGDPIKDGVGWLYGLYIQDEVRLLPQLTVNLGLRYELPLPFKDALNRVNGWLPGFQSQVFPEAPAGLVFPGDEGVGRAIIPTDKNNFAPRLGIAWDLWGNGRTVLRGGWGIFYDSLPQQGDVFQNILAPPFNPLTQFDFANDETTPRLANPFFNNPDGLQSRGFPSPVLFIGWGLDQEFNTPFSHHFNVSLQQQLMRDLSLEAAYVGSRGEDYPGFLEANPGVFEPGQTARGPRLNPEFSLVRPTYTIFDSWYDSLQVSLRKRSSNGLSFLASYTWAHAIDHASGLNLGSPPRPQDGVSLSDIRGNAQFDVRHRFVLSFTYELPGYGGSSWAARYLLGGWQLNGIFQGQTGFPFTATEPVDVGLRFQQNRPNQVCDPNSGAARTVSEFFRTDCFQRNTLPEDAGEFGSAGRNTIRGPRFWSTDLSLFKNIPIADSHRLQVRVEAFNAFNQTNFDTIVTNVGSPIFGTVTGAREGRIVQLGLKYVF